MAKTRTLSVTYLGVPARVEITPTGGPNSERRERTTWLGKAVGQPVEYPEGTVVTRVVKGKGYKTQQISATITYPEAV